MRGQGTGKIGYVYFFQFQYKDWSSAEERGNGPGAKLIEE